MLSSQMEGGELIPLLIAAGGGGNAYLEDPESSQDQIPLEQYENNTIATSTNGQTGAAGTILYYRSYYYQCQCSITCSVILHFQCPLAVSNQGYTLMECFQGMSTSNQG